MTGAQHDATVAALTRAAREARQMVVTMAARGQTPHVGSCLSCVDILVTLYHRALRPQPYNPTAPERDRFILSKGHAAMAQYACLAQLGILEEEALDSYAAPGSPLGEHPCSHTTPGIEFSTGSLGHGLGVAVGTALALRDQGQPSRVFGLLSDGELNEGTVWEAAQLAAARQLDNVVAIVDYNGFQAMGRCGSIVPLDPVQGKWEAFGWSAVELDGHSLDALTTIFSELPLESGRPSAIVARTVKGKGVSFLEDILESHYWLVTDEDLKQALEELGDG